MLKKFDLQDLQIKQLRNVVKEHNIKVTLKMRKAKIIESILKTQDSAFRNLVTLKLNLHNDITPARGESKSAYSIIETKSRFIKKFD